MIIYMIHTNHIHHPYDYIHHPYPYTHPYDHIHIYILHILIHILHILHILFHSIQSQSTPFFLIQSQRTSTILSFCSWSPDPPKLGIATPRPSSFELDPPDEPLASPLPLPLPPLPPIGGEEEDGVVNRRVKGRETKSMNISMNIMIMTIWCINEHYQ